MRFSGGNTIEEAVESRRPQLQTEIPKPATSSFHRQRPCAVGCWACSGAPAPNGDPHELVLAIGPVELAIGPVEPYEDLPYVVEHSDPARSTSRGHGGTAVMGGPPWGDNGVDRGGARAYGEELTTAGREDRPSAFIQREGPPPGSASALWCCFRFVGRLFRRSV